MEESWLTPVTEAASGGSVAVSTLGVVASGGQAAASSYCSGGGVVAVESASAPPLSAQHRTCPRVPPVGGRPSEGGGRGYGVGSPRQPAPDLREATDSDAPSDSGGGSGGGQGSGGGGGKKHKSGSESSSSSQQSGSGSRSGSGRRKRGSCSGSSNSSGDEEDDEDEKRRQPHGGGEGSKDLKPKLVDEDDEATDSADEGLDDTTPNMIMDFSPHSNQSGNGGPDSASSKPSHYPSGIYSAHSPPSSSQGAAAAAGPSHHRPTSLAPDLNHFEGKGSTHHPSGGGSGEIINMPMGNQAASGTVAIESMVSKESSSSVESSGAVNMIVGYGVPVSAPPPTQGAVDKSPPGSDLGTPTLDSPSPLGAEEKMTPLTTPVPMTPVLSPALTLLPQVSLAVLGPDFRGGLRKGRGSVCV